MKKTILALQPLLQNEMHVLEQSFNVLRLWESREPEETLLGHARDIVGILSTYNSKGVSCLLYTSPSPRDSNLSRMPSSA